MMAGSQAGCLGPIESLGVWCEEGERAQEGPASGQRDDPALAVVQNAAPAGLPKTSESGLRQPRCT